jgi:hypothetical protein
VRLSRSSVLGVTTNEMTNQFMFSREYIVPKVFSLSVKFVGRERDVV